MESERLAKTRLPPTAGRSVRPGSGHGAGAVEATRNSRGLFSLWGAIRYRFRNQLAQGLCLEFSIAAPISVRAVRFHLTRLDARTAFIDLIDLRMP